MPERVGFMALWSAILLFAYGGLRLVEWLIALVGFFHVWGIGWILAAAFTLLFWALALVWLLGLAWIAIRERRSDPV